MNALPLFIEDMSIPEPNSGCWLWMGVVKAKGYGEIGVAGRSLRAHRVSWTAFKGAIPTGLHVLHKCDVRSCVNPDHLFLGTNRQNVDDKVRKNRQQRLKGRAHGRSKITDEVVRELRAHPKPFPASLVDEYGERYGLSRTQIFRIRRGENWTHIP